MQRMPSVPIMGGGIKASGVAWEERIEGQALQVKAARAWLDLEQETAELEEARVELPQLQLAARTARLAGGAWRLRADRFTLRRGALTVTGDTVELDLHQQHMEARGIRALLPGLPAERRGRRGGAASGLLGAEVGKRGGGPAAAGR